jgi:hypothetical protein
MDDNGNKSDDGIPQPGRPDGYRYGFVAGNDNKSSSVAE